MLVEVLRREDSRQTTKQGEVLWATPTAFSSHTTAQFIRAKMLNAAFAGAKLGFNNEDSVPQRTLKTT
jgi:hypothetical protein